MISPSQRHLPDNTQHSKQTNIQAPGGIRTHNLSRRAAKDLRLRPHGHWDRRIHSVTVWLFKEEDSEFVDWVLWNDYMNQPLKFKCLCWNLQACVVEIFVASKWPNMRCIIRKVLVFLPLTLPKDCTIHSSCCCFSVLTASMKVCYITVKPA